MEYAEGGILMDKLKCTEDIASRYVEQAIDALQYMHKLKIAHRDIKPENIVMSHVTIFFYLGSMQIVRFWMGYCL